MDDPRLDPKDCACCGVHFADGLLGEYCDDCRRRIFSPVEMIRRREDCPHCGREAGRHYNGADCRPCDAEEDRRFAALFR